MSKPAARKGDSTSHLSKKLEPGPGSSNVLIEGEPAWRAVEDKFNCPMPIAPPAPAPHGPEICYLGSFGVLINGKMAVRMGDIVIGPPGPPNPIVTGAANVLIGNIAFGLARKANGAAFCRRFKALMKNWNSLTPAERQQKLQELINRPLKKSGLPPVSVNSATLSANTYGQFDFQSWSLEINKTFLNGPLNAADSKELANTVYHEARHAEQWYAIAQRQAAAKPAPTANQMSRSMSNLPVSVAQQALKNPLPADSPRGVFGDTMHRSIYGSRATYRSEVLNNISTRYNEYKTLPEESDAWDVESAVGGCP
ncbi:PAAR domain-containing protein [candidate division KSB1 bacterium]|nr:PAAR domain-containing protein [candidate division KSB1 bacterium]